MALGLETLDLARFHEQALITLVLPDYSPGVRDRMIRQAGTFFAEAITPIEKTHRAAQEDNDQLIQLNQALHQRSVDLIASNRRLQQEISSANRWRSPSEKASITTASCWSNRGTCRNNCGCCPASFCRPRRKSAR